MMKTILELIPSFLRTKKMIFFLVFLSLILLLTPFSLNQVNQKVAGFITEKSKSKILHLEKQIGLKVSWEELKFDLLSLTFNLKGISLEEAQNKASQKNLLFDFLDGTQRIDTLTIRPNWLSFLFQKKLYLSKVKIISGQINLKTAKQIKSSSSKNQKILNLPVKKIEIKNTNISLMHQGNQIILTQFNARFLKKRNGKYYFKSEIKEAKLHQEEPFALKAEGWLSQKDIKIKRISLQNENINVQVKSLLVYFKSNQLASLQINTFGELPFSSFYNLAKIFNKNIPYNNGGFSYSLDMNFDRSSGYTGDFEVKSKNFHIKNKPIAFLEAKGRLKGHSVLIDKGRVQLAKEGSIDLRQATLKIAKPYRFSFSSQVNSLPLINFLKTFYSIQFFPIQTIYSGSLNCKGDLPFLYLNCNMESLPIDLHVRNRNHRILSFYKTKINSELDIKESELSFTTKGTKRSTTALNIEGRYTYKNKELMLKFNGKTKLQEDINFYTPLDLKGDLSITEGTISIKKNNLILNGFLQANHFVMNNYDLDKIKSFVAYKNNKIYFRRILGYTGKTSYKGNLTLDLKNRKIKTQLQSSFLNIQDIIQITKKNIKWPFSISGTGEGSLSFNSSFSNFKEKNFKIKGNLFNSTIENEDFKTISLDISAEKGYGTVSLLEFQKERGTIKATGTFDKNLNLNLTCKGSNIPLERIRNINRILPWQQSGSVDFDMSLRGSLYKPKAKLEVSLTKSSLYIYPVKDSRFSVDMDLKGIKLSGNLIGNLSISNFFYPLDKRKPIFIQGEFDNTNFIQTILARYKKGNSQNYLSQISGHADLTLSKKDLKPINGKLFIQNLYVSKGNKWLQNQRSFSIKFDNRNAFLSPVNFNHHDAKILKIQKEGKDNFRISGYHSLDYWSFAFPFLKNLEGDIKMNLITSRNLSHLNPKGILTITNGLLALEKIPVFKDIYSIWNIDNNKIFIKKFESTIGNGTSEGSGKITFSPSKKMALNLDLNFTDAYLNIPSGFYTTGKGNLKITGQRLPYLLKGSYFIKSGVIKNDFSNSKSVFLDTYSVLKDQNKDNATALYLDIDLKTNNPVKVENSFINANIQGEAKIYGPLNELLINGQFSTINQAAKSNDYIIFKEQEFAINTGTVRFNKSPPNNPDLNITAQTVFKKKNISISHATGEENETEYKILLSASGPAKEVDIKLASQPTLSKKEIISLLTLGVSAQYFEEHIKDTTQYSYQLLGSFLLQQPLNRELRNKLGLNLNISPTLNIKTNEPVTKLTLRRGWFGKFQTSFSRTLEEFPTSDASIRYDMNRNFSLTASWLNAHQYVLVDDYSEGDRLGLDFEFNFEF